MIDSSALLSQATSAYTGGLQSSVAGQANVRGLSEEQAKKAAEQFESFFLGQMLEYMNTDIDGQGMFGGGHAEDVWRSMLNQEYGKEIAKSSSLGVADAVMRSMLQAQGESTSKDSAARAPSVGVSAAANSIVSPADAPVTPAAAAASYERMN